MKIVFVTDGRVVGTALPTSPLVVVECPSQDVVKILVATETQVEEGWTHDVVDGVDVFSKPTPKPPTVGPNEFHFLWTIQEQMVIEELRADDVGVNLFMRRLDDPRTTEVVLSASAVQAAIAHTIDALVAAGVIAPENRDKRLAAIISGKPV
ncbi:hypothetical protein GTP45_27560 [Pseudoduganella sp. FT55W]|uniref:Uncharacterized protein n=1 Tax=Duganella rivi TaxID=2666083 RepID=A0A7X4KER7_9BURK|nr:hypothetical protein [Duganella rivi]MYM70540.1 hypothetical protein [Duganella rivi]